VLHQVIVERPVLAEDGSQQVAKCRDVPLLAPDLEDLAADGLLRRGAEVLVEGPRAMMGPIVAVLTVAVVLGLSLRRAKGNAIGPARPAPQERRAPPS
jgi:hypothetical protein